MNSNDLLVINGHTNVAIYYMLNIVVESTCYGKLPHDNFVSSFNLDRSGYYLLCSD